VLDLTTKNALGENHAHDNRLPLTVSGSDGTCALNDFRSPLVRQRKSRGLDLTVQKLWKFKLQLESAHAANDVTSGDFERSESRDHERSRSRSRDGDLGCDRHEDEPAIQSPRLVEMQPILGETDVGQIVESRSSGQCQGQGHGSAEPKLRRVVATPGEDPLFYTSLMRLPSTRRKSQPTQVFILPLLNFS